MNAIPSMLDHYLARFLEAADRDNGDLQHGEQLQRLIDEYGAWITAPEQRLAWELLDAPALVVAEPLILQLRDASARCVARMEKIRARRLLASGDAPHDYFRNIEASIEEEFGRFAQTPVTEVVLVGSGSFPMTPLLIAQRTGARVVGIDVDKEAIELGRQVVDRLGPGLPIRLEHTTLDRLAGIGSASHVIFSSTVSVKYQLLDWLYGAARQDAVVIMRYGNGLKSLFNYPMEDTDSRKWELVETTVRPEHIFDVAVYRKALVPASLMEGGSR
ncbi:SAM-dependent methyltransferase [Paenibacillus sp. 1P07SE]|uniref:SAM-dependent methyltransferase n=1 Tax=Paenibacillus sp. 1P07SE TaxID=3132209 RepID=UPI0039A64A04